MAHEKLSVVDKKRHQYPSPDTHPVSSARAPALRATPVPPSPPPSSVSSLASPTSPTSLSPSLSQPCCRKDSGRLPHSVRKAFRALQQSQRGEYNGPSWVSFTNVSPTDLEALVSAAKSIKIYKLRYDHDPIHNLLILRMPEGHPHFFVKNSIQQAIWDHLRARLDAAIREQESTGGDDHVEALRSIETAINPLVEASTTLPDGSQKRPDVSFYYAGSLYPPLVIEVGHSQKSEELPTLARDFIDKTDGDIRTVLTVDLGYRDRVKRAVHRRLQRQVQEQGQEQDRQQKQEQRVTRSMTRSRSRSRFQRSPMQATLPSSLSLFRLGNIVLQDQPFRDKQGQGLEGGFELNVADFVPLANELVPREVLEALTFIVPFRSLSDGLARGERQQALEERTPTPQPEAQTSRKRVHFSWSLPEPDVTAAAETQSSDSEPSSSKRRKTTVGERLYRGRASSSFGPVSSGGSGDSSEGGQQGGVNLVVASRTRSKTRSRPVDG